MRQGERRRQALQKQQGVLRQEPIKSRCKCLHFRMIHERFCNVGIGIGAVRLAPSQLELLASLL